MELGCVNRVNVLLQSQELHTSVVDSRNSAVFLSFFTFLDVDICINCVGKSEIPGTVIDFGRLLIRLVIAVSQLLALAWLID